LRNGGHRSALETKRLNLPQEGLVVLRWRGRGGNIKETVRGSERAPETKTYCPSHRKTSQGQAQQLGHLKILKEEWDGEKRNGRRRVREKRRR